MNVELEPEDDEDMSICSLTVTGKTEGLTTVL